jgi:hypothetical protein
VRWTNGARAWSRHAAGRAPSHRSPAISARRPDGRRHHLRALGARRHPRPRGSPRGGHSPRHK